jgi:hypothetical protein
MHKEKIGSYLIAQARVAGSFDYNNSKGYGKKKWNFHNLLLD